MITIGLGLYSTSQLLDELYDRGLVGLMWCEEDFEQYVKPVPGQRTTKECLESCREALTDCTHSWDVISDILGTPNDDPEE